MICGLSHVAIRCRDIHASIRFYTQVLGLREAFRMHGEDGALTTAYVYIAPSEYIELFAGGVRDGDHGGDVIGMCHICLETPDVHAAYEQVKRLSGPLDTPVKLGKSRCLMFWTHDPDGNALEIMQLPPDSLQAQANLRLSGATE